MSSNASAVSAALLLGALFAGSSATGQVGRHPNTLVGAGYVFPSTANVAGQFGAHFKTKMTLYNPNSTPITIIVQLASPGGGSTTKNISLAADAFRRWENFLEEEFAYVGGAGVGMLESTVSKPFIAIAEVYTESANGRFSTPLTGLFTTDNIVSSGNSMSVVPGLRVNSANRANYGCASGSPVAAQVRVDFYGFSNGVQVGSSSATVSLLPYGWAQQAVPIQGDDVFAYFRLTSGGTGGLGVFCYGVNVNNTSNDGTSIPAHRSPPVFN